MKEFFAIAGSDFMDTFRGAYLFPLLLLSAAWILWRERELTRRLLLGALPLLFLFVYWCPLTGLLFMRLLGENVYWRILWLILPAVTIPYGFCLLLQGLRGWKRHGAFLACALTIVLCGTPVLASEEFLPSTNVWKLPQNVVAVCDLLPGNVHVLASNRLMPYLRQYDPSITLEFGRNMLVYNGKTDAIKEDHRLYLEAQKEEMDLSVLCPLARKEGCTFLVFSIGHTYVGDWEDYGYTWYGSTEEFEIFVDMDYTEGQDTRKWNE